MKSIYVVLIASLFAGGYAHAQSQTQTPEQTTTPEQKRHAAKAISTACKSDIEQLCPGKSGKAARKCLQTNEEKLSSECKAAMPNSTPKG